MPSAKYELNYLNEALSEMTSFLLAKSPYWPLGLKRWPKEPPYPRLTIGTALLSQARLMAFKDEAPDEITAVSDQLVHLKNRWSVIWQNKAAAEFPVRLRQWSAMLEEEPRTNYGNSVRLRVILHLLAETLEKPPGEASMLGGLDVRLKRLLVPDNFVWDDILSPAFPQETFWYLWGLPCQSHTDRLFVNPLQFSINTGTPMEEKDQTLLDAITTAKEFEIKASQTYLDAAVKTHNPKGVELFQALAGFERSHYEALTELGNSLRAQQVFNGYKIMATPSEGWKFDNSRVDPNSLELVEIIDLAIENEDKAEKVYTQLAEEATRDDVRELFTKLAAEERFHWHLLKAARTSLKITGKWSFPIDSLSAIP